MLTRNIHAPVQLTQDFPRSSVTKAGNLCEYQDLRNSHLWDGPGGFIFWGGVLKVDFIIVILNIEILGCYS